ncbi:MAG: hypothetical protein HS116_26170 [Planctomycetes bacterium]|nr:hypothetical protein [Planctomycetota bacterium]
MAAPSDRTRSRWLVAPLLLAVLLLGAPFFAPAPPAPSVPHAAVTTQPRPTPVAMPVAPGVEPLPPHEAVGGIKLTLSADRTQLLPADAPVTLNLRFESSDEKPHALLFGNVEPQVSWLIEGPGPDAVHRELLEEPLQQPDPATEVVTIAPGRAHQSERSLAGLPLRFTERTAFRGQELRLLEPGRYRIQAVYANRTDRRLGAGGTVARAWLGEVRSNVLDLDVRPFDFGQPVDGVRLELELDAQKEEGGSEHWSARVRFVSTDGQPHLLRFDNETPALYWGVHPLGTAQAVLSDRALVAKRSQPRPALRTIDGLRPYLETRPLRGRAPQAPLWLSETGTLLQRTLILQEPGTFEVFVVYSNREGKGSDEDLGAKAAPKEAWQGVLVSNRLTLELLPPGDKGLMPPSEDSNEPNRTNEEF